MRKAVYIVPTPHLACMGQLPTGLGLAQQQDMHGDFLGIQMAIACRLPALPAVEPRHLGWRRPEPLR